MQCDYVVVAPSGTRWMVTGDQIAITGGKTFKWMPTVMSSWYGIRGKTQESVDILAFTSIAMGGDEIMKSREQQHIDLSIDRCVKLGPGYPVHTGHGNIEWHTAHGVWRDKFNVGGNKYTTICMEALYKLCEANGWAVNQADTQSCDPRDDTRIPYDEAVQWVNAVRKQPPHPLAEIFKKKLLDAKSA